MPKCSRCPNEARHNQRLCNPCHAVAQREYRAADRNRLVRIESLVELLLEKERARTTITYASEIDESVPVRKGPQKSKPQSEKRQERVS